MHTVIYSIYKHKHTVIYSIYKHKYTVIYTLSTLYREASFKSSIQRVRTIFSCINLMFNIRNKCVEKTPRTTKLSTKHI